MITGAQIRAARELLGWSIPDLARRAAVNIADTQELEEIAKRPTQRLKDLAIIQAILEDVGIEFIDSIGVQLWPAEVRRTIEGGISGEAIADIQAHYLPKSRMTCVSLEDAF